MPPKLLPKVLSDSIQDSQYARTRDVQDEVETQDTPQPRASRNFEFVNSTGGALENSISYPSIRSHVMREANRITYASSTSQSLGSSSAGSLGIQRSLQPQVQKFKIGPSGLHPMRPSRPSRRGRGGGKSAPSRITGEGDYNDNDTEGQMIGGVGADDSQSTKDVMTQLAPPLEVLRRGVNRPRSPKTNRLLGLPSLQWSIVGEAQIDPFNSLPILSSRRTEVLIHYYQTQLIDSAPLMGGARQLWFGKAIQDSAFLLAKLCHAASSLRRMERGGDTAEALMLKNETIKIINERLDQSSSHISEGTICTVACMVMYEAMNGNLESTEIHIRGLRQMVQISGGLVTANSFHGLRRLIAWADIQASTALSTVPRLPSLDNLLGQHDTSNLHGSRRTQGLNEQVITQLGKLRHLNSYLISIRGNSASVLPQLALSDATYNLQRDLVVASNAFKKTTGLDHICCIAGLIFVERFLRQVNPNANIVGVLNERLQTSISEVEGGAQFSVSENPTVLLWACFIGAVTSKQVDWYLRYIVAIVESLEIRTWVQVDNILTAIVFPQESTPTAARVWDKVLESWATK